MSTAGVTEPNQVLQPPTANGAAAARPVRSLAEEVLAHAQAGRSVVQDFCPLAESLGGNGVRSFFRVLARPAPRPLRQPQPQRRRLLRRPERGGRDSNGTSSGRNWRRGARTLLWRQGHGKTRT